MHLFNIELSFLAVPACSPVTVLMLPQLNGSNGRTVSIFQILLIAQGRSGWRQQQLLKCCFVQVLELVLENEVRNVATKYSTFLIFCLFVNSH